MLLPNNIYPKYADSAMVLFQPYLGLSQAKDHTAKIEIG